LERPALGANLGGRAELKGGWVATLDAAGCLLGRLDGSTFRQSSDMQPAGGASCGALVRLRPRSVLVRRAGHAYSFPGI
ncbi:MAG TPA: hypothetical protein DFS52_18345, partial [Myxococcales bacterium]|nr:hypothetical protein [Myxococcales bacterium]